MSHGLNRSSHSGVSWGWRIDSATGIAGTSSSGTFSPVAVRNIRYT